MWTNWRSTECQNVWPTEKGKALRKHSLHEKIVASVLLKLFISGNKILYFQYEQHTIHNTYGVSQERYFTGTVLPRGSCIVTILYKSLIMSRKSQTIDALSQKLGMMVVWLNREKGKSSERDSSTYIQPPIQAAYFLWSCDKVYHTQEVCFLLFF